LSSQRRASGSGRRSCSSTACSPGSHRSSSRTVPRIAATPDDLVLILAPFGRDAPLAARTLRDVAPSKICADIDELCKELATASAVLLAEEALKPASLRTLTTALRTQPGWSDLPVIVFTRTRGSASAYRRNVEELAQLGNVTELERPVHPITLISAVRAAIRARHRQYQMRELIAQMEAALQQRDEFLAILGHELRNPLGAIANAVELSGRRDPDGPDELAMIKRQVKVLSRLVNDLLDVSRVTSGKISLLRERIDVVELVERLVHEAAPEARRSQVHLSVSSDPGPLYIVGDQVRLEQVFNNLLGNALKYTPARGRVEVVIAHEDDEVVVRVRDSGVGIPEDALPYIFDLFTQADMTIDRARGGMGIGLTLVRSLAQLHGGTVRATSAGPGKGSEFTVALPLTEEGVATAARPPAPQTVGGRRVLLIEDNSDNRTSLKELLEELGHVVEVARTGVEGVELALASLPEVALVDIGLPELDGYQVAQRVRSALGARIRLIALTGYGQPEDIRRARAAGFDAHLVKPVDLDHLERLLAMEPTLPD
jgi:signal transduction histidine kinase